MRKLTLALIFAAACTTQPASQTTSTTAPATTSATSATAATSADAPAAMRPRTGPSVVPIASRGNRCGTAVPLAATTADAGRTQENAWLADNFPGAGPATYTRVACEGKPVDEASFVTANGVNRTIYFDASGWAGK